MAQPVWITPAGSLGVIPEGIYYQQTLLASTDPLSNSPTCTATSATTNTITCSSTAGLYPGLNVMFTGSTFGGVNTVTRYFVLEIVSSTQFKVSATEFSTTPLTLTTATGSMTAVFTQHVYYNLQSGTLPQGVQVSDNGTIVGVPLAVASLQGVPNQVSQDVTNKFVIRAYTLNYNNGTYSLDAIRDRTFTLTITGNDVPEFVTPAGSIGTFYDSDEVNFQIQVTNEDPGDVVIVKLAGGELPGGLTLSSTGLISGYIAPTPNVDALPGYDITPINTDPYDFVVSAINKNFQFTLEVTDGKSSNLRTFEMYVINRDTLTADDTVFTADDSFITADETTIRAPFLTNASPSDLGRVRSDNYFAYQFLANDYDTTALEFVISVNEGAGLPPGLTLDPVSGWYYGYIPDQGVTEITYSFNILVRERDAPTVTSQLYPFTLTISGAIDAEVTWLTDSDLGSIENGATSLLYVEAVNRGGRDLKYRLKSGAFNQLPQGLDLLPSGEIAGRVSFNTFAIDLGHTTFDRSQSTVDRIQETTFDSSFTFTVNAYAEDTQQILYKVNSVDVIDGGTGFSAPPTITFNTPIGASAVQAQTGNITVSGGAITSVPIAESGDGYTSTATYTITGAGSGEELRINMKATGTRDVVSVFKTFTVRVFRAYNEPYQNLYIQAMPPANDRVLIAELLDNTNIFVPEYIFRPDDPNFGKSTRVTYEHAYGLAPDILDTYVESLYLNHYWKNLILGSIETAQALDSAGNVIYEVVYSKIVDDLVNAAGQSVNKIVQLPYSIIDPTDGSTIVNEVYPNSLFDMREQVIDTVGQISTKLPLWMTSKQTDGRVLGFTPAWVMCYTKPGRSRQIAYYIQEQFGTQLNRVDFKVDRYILDRLLSRNWDTTTQHWTPTPSLTTFDRFGSGDRPFIGFVDIATNLAFSQVNNRTLEEIALLGGLDGQVSQINGNKLIFVKQEYFTDLSITEAWQLYATTFGNLYDQGPTFSQPSLDTLSFDESTTIGGGYELECTETFASTDLIKISSTIGMEAGFPIWFSGSTFGGIQATDTGTGLTQIYYVDSILDQTCTATTGGVTDTITCASTANMAYGDAVWFTGDVFGGVTALTESLAPKLYYIVGPVSGPTPANGDPLSSATEFQISTVPGGSPINLTTATGTMAVNLPYFSISETLGGATFSVTNATGTMTAQYGNQRMAIWTINVNPLDNLVTLTLDSMTAESEYVQITRGLQFVGQQLYYPTSPAQGNTVVSWINVPANDASETTFDQGSMAFEEPVDMYDPTDAYDKYLVFPKSNILV